MLKVHGTNSRVYSKKESLILPISLSVNLNKVALIRNSRTDNNPNIVDFANICIDAGAAGLTAHPRSDQRHIRADDIPLLSEVAISRGVEFNIEGNPFAEADGDYPGLISLVESVVPTQCTLVPDTADQLTSDHGFDLTADFDRLYPAVQRLKEIGVRVSLFMDPIEEQITLAKKIGADRIELYTGPFALAFTESAEHAKAVFDLHAHAARHAHSLGLGVNAGHDLSLTNMQLYKTLPHLAEVSIGHALTADALKVGFYRAVEAYNKLCA